MPLKTPLRILGSRIDSVSEQTALDHVKEFLSGDEPHQIVTGNTLMLLEAEHDSALQGVLEKAALVVPESSGILWASRVLGRPLPDFTPGIDFMIHICQKAEGEGIPIYLIGSAPGIAAQAAHALKRMCPALSIVGTHHGFFAKDDEAAVLSQIRDSHPKIVFVGLGMPRQEKWIAQHLQEFGASIVMGVGGSFDVLSGHLKRAPSLFRRGGVEWLYRLAQEPWRWRRITQLPVFACKVLKLRLTK